MPVGEVVGVIQRSSQDMVVSITDEDTKALQSRQLTTRSVSRTLTHSNVDLRCFMLQQDVYVVCSEALAYTSLFCSCRQQTEWQ